MSKCKFAIYNKLLETNACGISYMRRVECEGNDEDKSMCPFWLTNSVNTNELIECIVKENEKRRATKGY